jgi:hypothetical protein
MRAGVAFLAPLVAVACSIPLADGRSTPEALPDAATFPPVAALLDLRCGTLDCHGTRARNLRLFGSAGLRWSPADRPLSPTCDTPEEVEQDYESVVGLEPETMGHVVASGGADPDALTMVRKARGLESHKGGAIWATGDASDRCLTSWLSGEATRSTCASAVLAALAGDTSNPLAGCVGP